MSAVAHFASGAAAVGRAVIAVLVGFIRIYQYAISPMFGQRCKYYPSCSSYAVGALREHGVFKGLGLAGWRLLRCNPFSNGGFDPVPPRGAHDNHGHRITKAGARV
jgi:putative membrane protein insertion efficiency factor